LVSCTSGWAKEGEQRAPFAGRVVQQPPVGRIDGPPGDEPVDRRAQPLGLGRNLGGIQPVGIVVIPGRQGRLEDAAGRMGGLGLAALGVLQQLTAAA
jgi:hypothetical protein